MRAYKRTHEMDKEKFAHLLYSAKGTRSLRAFAADCNVNASTFTRIMKHLNKGPSSFELIEAIAENAAPGSEVTLEKLAHANGYTVGSLSDDDFTEAEGEGMIPKDILPKTPTLSHYGLADHMMFSIICQELIMRDKEITILTHKYAIGKNMMYRPDALMQIRALDMADESREELWCMEFFQESFLYGSLSTRIFEFFSRFSFIGNSVADRYKPTHFALVVTDQKIYNEVVDDFGDHMFSCDLRLILISSRDSHIESEFMFPWIENKERQPLFNTGSQGET